MLKVGSLVSVYYLDDGVNHGYGIVTCIDNSLGQATVNYSDCTTTEDIDNLEVVGQIVL